MISNISDPIHPALQIREITKEDDTHRIFESTKSEDQKSYWTANKEVLSKKMEYLWGIQAVRDVNHDVFFITSRESKFEEVQRLLMGLKLRQAPLKLPALDQEEDLVKCAVYRVFQGFKHLQAPCFIEETALNVDVPGYQRGFPGHNYRVIVEQQIGKKKFAQDYAGKDANTLSVFAYTEDGKIAHVFKGDAKGKIVNPGDKWVEADGWDPFFQPAGYNQTLSQLQRFKHIVNMRQIPCAEMRSVMRNKEYPGVYEVHITVYNCAQDILNTNGHKNPLTPTPEYKDKFEQVCAEFGVKALYIGMDNPLKPIQLQTAAYHSYQNYQDAVQNINELAREFLKRGLPVLRLRLEAMLHNRESPKTDDDALKADAGNYFEFHARLADVNDDRFEDFKLILQSYCREGLGTHGKGHIKTVYSTVRGEKRYFVNMRSYKIGSERSLALWKELQAVLNQNEFTIAKVVKPEYCVYDEKPHLDATLHNE